MRNPETEVHKLVLSDVTTLYLATVFDGSVTGVSIDPCSEVARAKASSEYVEAVEISRVREADLVGSYATVSQGPHTVYPHPLLPIDYSGRLFSYGLNEEIAFASVEHLKSGQEVFVPAGFVYPTAVDPRFSSSGAAIGQTVEEAIVRASLELYERDAMVSVWLGCTRPVPIDISCYHGLARSIHQYFTERGWRIYSFSLPTRIAGCNTVMTIGFSPEESQTLISIGTACSSSLSQAADKAFVELLQIVVVLLNKTLRRENEISEPIDHLLSYHRPERREILQRRIDEWVEGGDSVRLHSSWAPPPSIDAVCREASDLLVKRFPALDTGGGAVLVKVFSPSLNLLDFGEDVIVGPRGYKSLYQELRTRWGTATHPFP